jgi:hypothetical protein
MKLVPAAPFAHSLGKSLPILLGSLALILFTSVASSTTVIQLGTVQLADQSNTIVRGAVTAVESRMHPEHHFIYTYVSLRVDEVFRGNPGLVGCTITLQELGGRVGRQIHEVPGVPQFETGEEILSFLENHVSGYFRTYGMVQGKFRFETDARTGILLLTRPAGLNEANLAGTGIATDLTPARPDGKYEAAPLLRSLRDLAGRR